jgi:hypothetical protein
MMPVRQVRTSAPIRWNRAFDHHARRVAVNIAKLAALLKSEDDEVVADRRGPGRIRPSLRSPALKFSARHARYIALKLIYALRADR